MTRDDLMRLPHHVPSSYRNRFEQKTENVINIIKNCEYLKEEYVAPQYEWNKSLDQGQEDITDDHKQLKSLSKGKRMFFLRPQDQDMIKRPSAFSYDKTSAFSNPRASLKNPILKEKL